MPFDSKNYRQQLGFSNQAKLRKYFKANDIISVNWDKIEQYNARLKEMFLKINQTVHPSIRWTNINELFSEIDNAYSTMRENDVFPRLNNNGRTPENVYYNWMRGYIVCKYFAPALSKVFNVPQGTIRTVGHDSLADIETFSKSPTADLEITTDNHIIRLEIQSGYTGINDIKAHKVKEARRVLQSEQMLSYIVHFDLFNGTMAIVDITDIDENDINWVIRNQMEGQKVFSIPDEAFRWFLLDEPPHYSDIVY